MTTTATSSTPAPLKALPTIKSIFDEMATRFKFRSRDSQTRLSEITRSTIALGGVACVEATTGTGKTLGYLVGALDAQAHSAVPLPIVVATATVSLQEQILRDDIPRLAAVGAVDPRKCAVAKGRGRYFCPRTAVLLEDRKAQDNQFDMFDAGKHVADRGTPIALNMLRAWRSGDWDGDRDNWIGDIPECWNANCGASSDTCVNRACEFFDRCPYMASRAKLSQAQLIIANQDIVLADLAQRAEEQSSTALPPKKYVLIFDEAHNLPDKAVSTKRATAYLSNTDWLRGVAEYGDRCFATPRIERALTRQSLASDVFAVNASKLLQRMEQMAKELADNRKFDEGGAYSWGLESPEKDLREQVLQMGGYAVVLLEAFKTCVKAFTDLAEEAVGSDKAFAVRMLAQTHKYARLAKSLFDGMDHFCTNEQVVRWVQQTPEGDISLQTQPLEGSDVLTELLWKTEWPVVMVSATLQIAGSFGRFKDKAGLPARTFTEALPPVFDYTRGFLHQPRMSCSPNDAGYEAEVAEKVERLFANEVAPGMLVLFTSRQSMRRVVSLLPAALSSRVLVQDQRSIPELVAQHREIIDRGERSILMGLDSMSEGLDLPGKYLGHVVITRLPFAVPGDPVEEARREHLGKAWFEHAYLADMLTMLIQAAGRLLRREDDHGVISVLDKRLSTKSYAMKAMKALPDFTRGTNLQGYFDMLAARGLDASHGMTTPAKPAEPKKPRKPRAPKAPVAAPAPVFVPVVAPVVSDAPEGPLDTLMRLVAEPSDLGIPVRINLEGLPGWLFKTMPFTPGPFPDDEPEYLSSKLTAHPVLPSNTPWSTWGERRMPQAVMLGLRLMNLPWASEMPAWFQMLALRADLVQFAEVMRAHQMTWPDERRALLAADACREQLKQGLAGLGDPDEMDIYQGLDLLESSVLQLVQKAHRIPNRSVLMEMANAALRLGIEARKR